MTVPRTKVVVEIEYDSPYPDRDPQDKDNINWFSPPNIELALRESIGWANMTVRAYKP